MPQEGLWKKVQVITMGTFTYTTDSEIVSGHSADRFKAAAGLGDGFNGHAGTGTVAQAAEQVTQATRWFASTTRSTVEGAIKGDSEAKADALGLQLAVVDQALRLNGFKATWSVKTENGTEQVDPRNASMALATFASTLAVEITTTNTAEETQNACENVRHTMIAALRNLDKLDGAYEGQGKDFFVLMMGSPVVAIAIADEGSALASLAATAKRAVENAKLVESGSVFGIDTSNLDACPVCGTATSRNELVCRAGHKTAAAVRAEQEKVVLAAAFQAANLAGLDLAVSAKVKGLPRFELQEDSDTVTLASVQDVSAKVSFRTEQVAGDLTAAWTNLASTSKMFNALETNLAPATAGAEVRSRVLRTVVDALNKAADKAAEVIADPIRTEVARVIVENEQQKSVEEFARIEEEYRKELLVKASRPTAKQLATFVEETNKKRRFAGPASKTSGPSNGKKSFGRKPGNKVQQKQAGRRDLNGRKRSR
jgi:hypothetical protein